VAQLRGLVGALAFGRLKPRGLTTAVTNGRGEPAGPHRQSQTVAGWMRWPSDEEQRRQRLELVDEALRVRRRETNVWMS
jgi:hypothetical protein